jgi:hypothetical protein
MCEQAPNANGVRPSRWYAIRNTFSDLMSTTVKDWLELTVDLGHFNKGGLEPPTHHIRFKLEDGTIVESEMIFLALDREDAVKKLRGVQATGFWLNEAKELAKPIVDMADLRHGRYPSIVAGEVKPTWHGMLGDTNAPSEDSWYYHLAEVVKPEGWEFHRQPGAVINVGTDKAPKWIVNEAAENLSNLPEGYYSRGMEGKDFDWINVNLANNYGFVRAGKSVYPEYNDFTHCKAVTWIPAIELYRGWDFGIPACVFVQYSPTGRFNVLDELTSDVSMGINRFADDVLTLCAQKYPNAKFIDVGDPAGNARSQADEKTCYQILQGKGIQISGEEQDPTIRIESVKYALNFLRDGDPMFALAPHCKELRKGFMGGYHYRKIQTTEERYSESPEKNASSHPHDALQYIATRLFAAIVRGRKKTTSTSTYVPTRRVF